MKIYIEYGPDKALYPVRLEDIAVNLDPESFCEIDKYNYELSMDSAHNVTLDFAPFSVDMGKFERDLDASIVEALHHQYGKSTFTDCGQKQ